MPVNVYVRYLYVKCLPHIKVIFQYITTTTITLSVGLTFIRFEKIQM